MTINPKWQAAEDERVALEEAYKIFIENWQKERKESDEALLAFNEKLEAANKKLREIPQEIEG